MPEVFLSLQTEVPRPNKNLLLADHGLLTSRRQTFAKSACVCVLYRADKNDFAIISLNVTWASAFKIIRIHSLTYIKRLQVMNLYRQYLRIAYEGVEYENRYKLTEELFLSPKMLTSPANFFLRLSRLFWRMLLPLKASHHFLIIKSPYFFNPFMNRRENMGE